MNLAKKPACFFARLYIFSTLQLNSMKPRNVAIVSIIVAVVVLGAASWFLFLAPPAGPPVLKIGALNPLSGPFAGWGTKHLNGAKMAASEINARGGVFGKQIELVINDDKNDPKEAVTIYRRMVEADQVISVIGPVSSDVAIALSGEAEKLKIPILLHMAGSEKILTKASRHVFRTCLAAGPMMIEAEANYIREKGYNRVGAIVADYAWGRSIKGAIEKNVAALPGVKVQIEVAPVREADFTPYLRKLQELDPQFLIVSGHPPGTATIMKQALELGLKSDGYIGPNNPTEAWVKALGDNVLKGVVDWSCANHNHPDYVKTAEKYFEQYKELFDFASVAGYVNVHHIVWAIEKSRSFDSTAIASTIRTGRFEHPLMAWPMAYTEWGELKEATPQFVTFKTGPPPGKVSPGATLHLEPIFKSKPVAPLVPEA